MERILYPATATAKADLISYYVAVSDQLLPFLEDRPLSLRRFPEGVEGEGFWQKRCPDNHPDWVQTAEVEVSSGKLCHCLANDLPSLLWLVAQGTLEFHTTLHRHERKRPDFAIFDLDPGPGKDLLDCAALGLRLHHHLEAHGLRSFAKSSGKKGLHVMVPLKGTSDYATVKEFALEVARDLERESPDEVTSTMAKRERKGKVFIDWSQNDPHKTTVAAFSTRAVDLPTVSTPLEWVEVESALDRGDTSNLVADIGTMVDRAIPSGRIIGQVLGIRQSSRLLSGI